MSRVTVLIPNYNGATYLRECVESVRAQTFSDWAIVVGDNASTDGSVRIIDAIVDPRIRLVRRPTTIGWVANVNLLLAEAQESEYVAILHADDWWESGFLSTMVELLDNAPTSLMATSAVRQWRGGRAVAVDGLHRWWPVDRGTTCPPASASWGLTRGCCVFTPSVLARAELYRRFGGYDESLPQACDWLMWLTCAGAANIEVCGEPLATYRVHEHSLTAQLGAANLRGVDLVRLVMIMASNWKGREPVPGAIRQLARTVTVELLAYAGQRADAGDREGAIRQAGLARAVAPPGSLAVLAALGEAAFRCSGLRVFSGAQRKLMRAGRLAWHVAHPSSADAMR
jgi:hypothetical protein